jgi:hypothetical protein
LPNNGITLPGDPGYLSRGQYHQTQRNYTEEFRLTSTDTPDSVLSWVVGFFYQHNDSGDENTFAEPFDQVANYLSEYYYGVPGNSLSYFGEAPVDGRYSYLEDIQVTEIDKAAFGNLTWRVTPTVRLSAGASRKAVSATMISRMDHTAQPPQRNIVVPRPKPLSRRVSASVGR